MKAIITIAMLIANLFSVSKEKKADIWNMGLYADSTRCDDMIVSARYDRYDLLP